MRRLFVSLSAAALAGSMGLAGAADNMAHPADAAQQEPAGASSEPGMSMKPAEGHMRHCAMHKKGMYMKRMDTNQDGLLTKDEFMSGHEAFYDKMKKNAQGSVDLAGMASMGGSGCKMGHHAETAE